MIKCYLLFDLCVVMFAAAMLGRKYRAATVQPRVRVREWWMNETTKDTEFAIATCGDSVVGL